MRNEYMFTYRTTCQERRGGQILCLLLDLIISEHPACSVMHLHALICLLRLTSYLNLVIEDAHVNVFLHVYKVPPA